MPYVIEPILSERDPYSWFDIPRSELRAEGGGGWMNILGGPVLPEDQPTRALKAIKTSKKKDPELTYAHGGYPSVTEKVKAIIEHFEPGKHQFFPVDLYSKGGKLLETGRYMLNVTTVADAIIDGHVIASDAHGKLYSPTSAPLTLRADSIDGLHLWRDAQTPYRIFFLSNELFNALKAEDCLRVRAHQVIVA